MNVFIKTLFFSLILLLIYSCQEENRKPKEKQESSKQKSVFKLFEKVHPDSSNIHFSNNIGEISRTEYLSFQYVYNGGGVGIGDFNNDGLKDVFFTGNDVSNALYINQGGFQFKDISESAGILGGQAGGNGVCIVDINNDGYQDIYISNGGNKLGNDKKNALYINNKDLTFKESAEQFGIADTGWTSQSVFFDFDNDGDLDIYVMNHANEWLSKKDGPSKNDVAILSKDHLYRNDNNLFVDVSKSAGLIEEKFGGFGLGIAIADINLDGYQDIYISSDYDSPDLLYINQGNGTFKEEAKQRFGHISYFSMGADIADFNNDGLLDIFSLDMSAEDHTRIKTQMSGMAPERFNALIDYGLPHQYMYNALQKNNGDGTFTDIAQFSNVESTDWSWSPLFADFDNDGLKDLFITNGSRYDLRDNDYRRRVKFSVNTSSKLPFEQKKQILDQAPSTPLSNYAYQNTGNLKFKKKSYEWGLSQKGFSQGAAYADLDNDGDLDLIINNVDEKSWVYQNKSEELQNSFIKINLEADWSECIGAIIKVSSEDTFQIQNFQPCRGYMSTIDNTIHFGLGNQSLNINIEVFWPDGTKSRATSSPNSTLSISKKDSPTNEKYEINTILKFQTLTNTGFNFTHKENKFDDFQAELLLPHKNSQYGPALACADINNDGLEDIFIGGSINQAGETYLQNSKGQFNKLENGCFKIDKIHEDIGAKFFDFDNDGDMDLYIASGSNEFIEGPEYDHRFYINNGNGKFSKTTGVLPNVNTSGKSIAVGDFNSDGNPDLFVGGRQTPGKYPLPPESYLLIYESGKFVNKTTEICSELKNIGMVTASEWVDIDNDKDLDLIVVGEWMAIEIFVNENGKLQSLNNKTLNTNVGWWSSLNVSDFDGDGDQDFLVGNLGLNYKYKASKTEPFQIWSHDFDQNGTLDIVLGYYDNGTCYPVRGRQCSSDQMPFIKDKFPTYNAFAQASTQDIYGPKLNEALNYKATNFASVYVENLGNGEFSVSPLPTQVQLAMVNSIVSGDFNNDGIYEAILAGNLYGSEVETPRSDGSIGSYLTFDSKKNQWKYHSYNECGLSIQGNTKNMDVIQSSKGPLIVAGKNNTQPQIVNVVK